MLRFDSDYMEGCHTDILNNLVEANFEKNTGYGLDVHTMHAKELIKESFNLPNDSLVYLLSGGTITNKTLINSVLRGYECVISPDTGHIQTHEAGAVEAMGTKIVTLKNNDGKISAEQVSKYMDTYLEDHGNIHLTVPKMVYITFPTETGTLYTKKELVELKKACEKYNLFVFIDGARLGYGLVSPMCDIDTKEIKDICDFFYIGGTKVGALFGEALVVINKENAPHLFTSIKRNGALLSKGFVTGIQFETLFTNNLYFEISKNAVKQSLKIKDALVKKGYKLYCDSYTNQQFVIIDQKKKEELKDKLSYTSWGYDEDNNEIIRLVTSWATTDKDVDELINLF